RTAALSPVPARLLIGNETISHNPKLNNVCKRAATYDWIVMADSNVLMPRDYIERLRAAWRADTGVVSSPPAGCRPQGFWAELECPFLNTYPLRCQYTPSAIGLRFATGIRLGLCPGQVDALSAQPDRAGRRHSIARARARRGCGHDQTRARLWAARSPGRRAVRAAARLSLRRRSVGASTALGAAPAGL